RNMTSLGPPRFNRRKFAVSPIQLKKISKKVEPMLVSILNPIPMYRDNTNTPSANSKPPITGSGMLYRPRKPTRAESNLPTSNTRLAASRESTAERVMMSTLTNASAQSEKNLELYGP